MGDNAGLHREGITGSVPGSKDVCDDTSILNSMQRNTRTSCDLVRRKATTHSNSGSRFHSSFNSSEMSHQPVTCCAGSKQE